MHAVVTAPLLPPEKWPMVALWGAARGNRRKKLLKIGTVRLTPPIMQALLLPQIRQFQIRIATISYLCAGLVSTIHARRRRIPLVHLHASRITHRKRAQYPLCAHPRGLNNEAISTNPLCTPRFPDAHALRIARRWLRAMQSHGTLAVTLPRMGPDLNWYRLNSRVCQVRAGGKRRFYYGNATTNHDEKDRAIAIMTTTRPPCDHDQNEAATTKATQRA
ncbi:hypothetical protein V8E53_009425 [Lactarius tabidus]